MSLDGARITMLVMNDVSRDARVQKEARSAAAAGATVTVIGVGESDYSSPKGDFEVRLVQQMIPSLHPVWPVRVAQNLLRDHSRSRRLERAAVATEPDIVHSNDLNTLHIGARAARATQSCLVYDSHELFTETAGHRWWKRLILRARERRLIGTAKTVITVNPIIATELAERYGLENTPLVIYNGASFCLGEPSPDNTPMRFLYQGGFLPNRGLESLIGSVKGLHGRCELTLQGWGPLEADLKRLVEELQLDDVVRFIPPVPPEEVVRHASKHDVGVIVHKANSLNNKYSSPNKLFDYMGAGLAVLASDLPFLRGVLEEEGCGMLFDPEADGSLRRAILQLCEDRNAVARMKIQSARACTKYSWAQQSRALVDAYERVRLSSE